eukprot:CAMPEP_0174894648 /NCGR_PEP_ID=MMETSP0167-20121228/9235_1 /TAXON_ID=38298 /ORGANISM="Rhodella maculata, Strain CCMP736" /LENGTH=41 /DNA_ID= /DNA_START= /DNA_END= /DNA_ORIENTATION=
MKSHIRVALQLLIQSPKAAARDPAAGVGRSAKTARGAAEKK